MIDVYTLAVSEHMVVSFEEMLSSMVISNDEKLNRTINKSYEHYYDVDSLMYDHLIAINTRLFFGIQNDVLYYVGCPVPLEKGRFCVLTDDRLQQSLQLELPIDTLTLVKMSITTFRR